ncbi:signal recognition particle-docking protein FtsY [Bordetella genomosp. 10]|uniref:signal recognition particle-docking protein FtsY n=1 Tax=Bordetella genomosp. 10 TaxID=1416804 RepID=UPI00359C51F4
MPPAPASVPASSQPAPVPSAPASTPPASVPPTSAPVSAQSAPVPPAFSPSSARPAAAPSGATPATETRSPAAGSQAAAGLPAGSAASPPAPASVAAEPVTASAVQTPSAAYVAPASGQPAPPMAPVTPPAAPPVTPSTVAQPEPSPAAPAEAAPAKTSWLNRLKKGLARTGQSIGGLFVGVKVDENLFEELESALIMADAGLEATEKLLTALRARVKKDRIEDPAKVRDALRELLADHLRPLERRFDVTRAKPLVVMIAGVNGAGKTTSIGKLAYTFQQQGASVLLAAGDTFRAAAREQLMQWGARNNVTVIAQEGGDPAAVAFDAVNAGRARGASVVMVDTAGRLPTQLHLMEELKKIRRVIGKADANAPHEVLLVIDGNTGQNALAQIRAFDAAINLTGLVVTKLDGTAKGGTLAAVAAGSQGVRPVPVYWIGVGEGLEDLQPFVADEFAGALLAG